MEFSIGKSLRICKVIELMILLNLLDWNLIKQNPKIVMGYSANTILLLGIHNYTNLVTFHGRRSFC
ncbi:LD-carboxypeptidase [Bacillus niameyensis]|uniref:LD-carboxypeptidase n=1 Tax=Bacillus niameyensis TaxID=1522308 RepID=UPI000A01792A|nr:LD-carboxypeptidase [Bacillus niameyensis]